MSNYDAENITVLEGLEAVRKRPAMYIGNTDMEGLHKVFEEILDNSVDEFMGGYATEICAKIFEDGSAVVADNGRGIPTDIHPKTGKPALETILTVLHAGGKFDQKNYEYSGGLHGVGASVTNALAEFMQVFVLRKGEIHMMEFKRGKTQGEMAIISLENFKDKYPQLAECATWKTAGTITYFKPDSEIFEQVKYNINSLETTLRQTAYLAAGLKIHFISQQEGSEPCDVVFHYPNGLMTYLENVTKNETLITPIIQFKDKIPEHKFEMEVVMAYGSSYTEKLFPFTNIIANSEGGMHVTGFKTALTRIFNKYAVDKGIFKKDEKFSPEDVREGLRAIISVKMVDPQFTSQAKVKLGSTIARKLADKIASERLEIYFEENPKVAASIITKAQLSMKARMAARAARESVVRKGVMESMALPGKLADCSSKDPTESELFIVEGDSAGGSAKQGRNREHQAILPLRGKVMNTERASLDRILNYEGIKNMVVALGTGIGDLFDVSKLRYHKLILMTDADVDGAHITTLLLTFLYRYMPDLVTGGYIYLARPPLFKVSWSKKNFEYVYSEEERDAVVNRIRAANPDKEMKFEIQRYKGLGEMNPDQLWETTLDPETRLLYQVTIGDAIYANTVFQELMGDDVEPRRRFIEENARFAEVDLV